MAWMELHASFRFHRKVRRLARMLELSLVQARGHIITLWMACLEEAPDGCLASFDAAAIEETAEWTGAPGAFVAAMIDVKLIDRDDASDVLHMHDWMEYAASYKEAQRKANKRKEQKMSADRSRTVGVTDRPTDRQDRPTDRTDRPTSAADTPPPAPAAAGQRSLFSPPDDDAQIPQDSEEAGTAEAVVLEFPAVGRGASSWALTRAHLDELTRAYPDLDVEAEMRKALAKIRTGAVRKKTARGYPAFLANWLDRSMTSAPSRRPRGPGPAGAQASEMLDLLPEHSRRNLAAVQHWLATTNEKGDPIDAG